jgi:hypothetical protein
MADNAKVSPSSCVFVCVCGWGRVRAPMCDYDQYISMSVCPATCVVCVRVYVCVCMCLCVSEPSTVCPHPLC